MRKLTTVCVWAEIKIQRTRYQIAARSVTLEPACSIICYNFAFLWVIFRQETGIYSTRT